ncbi:hexosaminidase [Chitinophaga dinghuensis]|uniref:beta-N-acetylhexosaminidase n=1 Tax=Chitinophaga dinghuensis TaxID=1539050 RepID=A0A327W4K7_9BACT|nr:family 20 glycosylhydrolase [Chitinophaga dinghuensis]RAJ79898.1 hexosaminidase [Chitinophaga dinghuensis]
MIKRLACCLTLLAGTSLQIQAQTKPNLDLIPKPSQITPGTGTFKWTKATPIIASKVFEDAARLLADSGQTIGIVSPYKANSTPVTIQIMHVTANSLPDSNSYKLEVKEGSIGIYARTTTAAINGIQTLLQLRLLQPDMSSIPCVQIQDHPRFGYRGVMLDVSRHFFPISYIKRYLDLMALYKINTFHWHLVDGAGWRLQIKQFPELTDRAAWRYGEGWKEWAAGGKRYANAGDPNAYGGYYTQDDAREIVAYAAQRGITVIPEIEMPGHSEEVLAVYPQLSCSGIPYVNSELCLGNDATYSFLEKVLTEVMAIFPSTYIHIGGDEANKKAWKACPKCQQRIHTEHLKDEHELQSYAVRRMEKFLKSHHRKLLGWDEILEGGLAPEATVMSWRGESGGITAAKAGHDVIMTPGAYCYFDHYQADPATQPEAQGGYLPVEKVYSYNPDPFQPQEPESKHILGVQANIWTELIPNSSHLEYMTYPRLPALAEVAWTNNNQKDFSDFQRRLQSHYLLLQRLYVNYCRPSYTVTIVPSINYDKKETTIRLESQQYQPVIRYTMDGTAPDQHATRYTGPFSFTGSANITAAVFRDTLLQGKPAVLMADYHLAIGKPVIYKQPYSKSYPAKKEATLTDGYLGTVSYGDSQWQGFDSHDMDVVVDMEAVQSLRSVALNFMQLTAVGIYIPADVTVSLSDDGITFGQEIVVKNDVPESQNQLTFKQFRFDLGNRKSRYIRVKAKNAQHGFLFADEIIVH